MKEQRGVYLAMLLGALGASLLVNMMAGKGMIIAGNGVCRWRTRFLITPHP